MGDQGLREALEEFCADESSRVVMRSEVRRLLAAHPAAMLELTRPMPTREQIASVLRDHTWIAAAARCSCGDEYIEFVSHHQADAVLALLNGSGQ